MLINIKYCNNSNMKLITLCDILEVTLFQLEIFYIDYKFPNHFLSINI